MAYFPGVGAFEQLSGGGGMLKLRFEWYKNLGQLLIVA